MRNSPLPLWSFLLLLPFASACSERQPLEPASVAVPPSFQRQGAAACTGGLDLDLIAQWGGFGTGDGQFNQPEGVALSNGFVYVADELNRRMQKFTTLGGFVLKWGTPGSGNGQFGLVWDVATDPVGNVYVIDYGNHRVQKFDQNGNFLLKWGSFGTGNGQFTNPRGVAKL